MEVLSFYKARKIIRSLKLKSHSEWRKYSQSGKKPNNIPSNPDTIYANDGWKSWSDWLDADIRIRGKDFLSFEEAREFVQKLNLENYREWCKYRISKDVPVNIPSNPNSFYKTEWVSWGNWLGIGNVKKERTKHKIKYLSFKEAREFVQKLNLEKFDDWLEYRKSWDKPNNIPFNPDSFYKNEWTSWGDWLGIASLNKEDKKDKKPIINLTYMSFRINR